MAAKIVRKAQKLFASNASLNQIAKYGSLAAGTPVRYDGTADPDLIQALSNFLDGWNSAVMGPNSPAIEDRNALDFLFARQIAYILQTGIAEWNVTTEYFIGSFAQDNVGNVYVSRTNNNLGNALTVTANWKIYGSKNIQDLVVAGAVLGSTDVVRLGGAGSYTVTFPAPSTVPGKEFVAKMIIGATGVKTISPAIDGVTLTLDTEAQFIRFVSNGTAYEQVG